MKLDNIKQVKKKQEKKDLTQHGIFRKNFNNNMGFVVMLMLFCVICNITSHCCMRGIINTCVLGKGSDGGKIGKHLVDKDDP